MSSNETKQEVEQITKEVEAPVKRKKDPKKVAAGKALAAKNKKAREALEKVTKQDEAEEEPRSWLPALSFSDVVSAVGVGITIFEIWRRSKNVKSDTDHKVKSVTFEEPLEAPPILKTRNVGGFCAME